MFLGFPCQIAVAPLGGTLDGNDALGAEEANALLHHEGAQPGVQAAPIALSLHLKAHGCHPVVMHVLPVSLHTAA